MSKKLITLGVVLVLIGSTGLAGTFFYKHKERQHSTIYRLKQELGEDKCLRKFNEWSTLSSEEKERNPWGKGRYSSTEILKSTEQEKPWPVMEKLLGAETPFEPCNTAFYEAQQDDADTYSESAKSEMQELIVTVSTFSVWAGLGIMAMSVLRAVLRLIKNGVKRCMNRLKRLTQVTIRAANCEEPDKSSQKQHYLVKEPLKETAKEFKKDQSNTKKQTSLLANYSKQKEKQPPVSAQEERQWLQSSSLYMPAQNQEDSVEISQTDSDPHSASKYSQMSLKQVEQAIRTQSEKLKATRGNASGQSAAENPCPAVTDTVKDKLDELTEQISAIRQYAAYQQEKMKKLQDGYDWNIVKNFCVRIIRCIDNLDIRIRQLAGHDGQTRQLEEIRDELIFALESSGVEQFEPELYSDYTKQGKMVEAVREREGADEPEMAGKIAAVVRPGYQYFISENSIKVIRPAQVRLFDCAFAANQKE